MKLILHIGMPKAGSTSLQAAFAGARAELRRSGVLCPRGTFNHNFLIAGLVPPERIGRLFLQHYAGRLASVPTDFAAFWSNIERAVVKHRPSTLILSGESLFGSVGEAGPDRLRQLLAPLKGRLEVVCYVRRPSDYYLSSAQQQLKASSVLPPVRAIAYRRPLEVALAAADQAHIVRYDRKSFPEGDIVQDFARRFLPPPVTRVLCSRNPELNSSMSAEVMDLVQMYRREQHAG